MAKLELRAFSPRWADCRFYFLPLGVRRAKRVSRWFGGGGRLPRIGYEMTLRPVLESLGGTGGPLSMQRSATGIELHGHENDLRYVVRILADQERAERRNARGIDA